MRSYLWLVVAGTVGMMASLGCSSSDDDTTNTDPVGQGGSAGQGGDAGAGGDGGSAGNTQSGCEMFNEFPGECDSCLENSCMSQCTACEANESCRELLACAFNCMGDTDCVNGCRDEFPDGVADFDPYFGDNGCLQQNCIQCVGCGLGTSDETCDNCFQDKCLVECAEATIDPNLMTLLSCIQGCSDDTCAQACVDANPEAYAKLEALDDCMADQCSVECTGGGGCGLTTQDPACDGCFQVKCEAECTAASSDPDLMKLLSCMQACTDNACMEACVDQYPDAYAKLEALDTCMASQCADECGGGGGCGLTTQDPTCDGCFQVKCETECVDATSDEHLMDLLGCMQACTDDACMQGCVDQYPESYAKLEALDTCMAAQCATECGGGGGCSLTTQDATCDGCFQVKCETECVEAVEDPNLMTLLSCLQGCSDDTCMQGCVNQYPDAYAKLEALDSCMAAQCATECGGGGGCSLTTQDATCDGCFQVKCETECVEAVEDANLNALLSCLQGCSDDTCLQGCVNQYPDAYAKLEALDSCMAAQCATECGGGGGCGLTTQDATCDGCFQVKCETECAAASADPNLNALLTCLQGCSDATCLQNCVNQYPDAYAKLEALDTCMGAQCATECGTPTKSVRTLKHTMKNLISRVRVLF